MAKKNTTIKRFFGWVSLPIWLAVFTFALTELFSRYPKITETVYSKTIYPLIAYIISFTNKWVSFSLSDILYAILALFLLLLVFLLILRKIGIGKFSLLTIQILAIFYVLFYWLWGFNYYRSGLNERLQISKSKPDTIIFTKVLANLIDRTNKSYCSFDSIKYSTIDSLIEISYRKNSSFLKLKYPQGTRRPKSITLSNFFAKASIAGYYGPFLGEIHLNDSLLAIEYPQVLAHEMAHQFGITSEAEANFYSWFVCTKSDSKHLKYSANINSLNYFLSQAKNLHSFQLLINQIDKKVINDIKKVQDHWRQMRNEKIDKVAEKVNDAYLKTNKIEKGIEDYFGVVQFIMDYESKNFMIN